MRVAVIDNQNLPVVAWDTPRLARAALTAEVMARLDKRRFLNRSEDREALLSAAINDALLALQHETLAV